MSDKVPEQIGPPDPSRFAARAEDLYMVDLGPETDLLTDAQKEANEKAEAALQPDEDDEELSSEDEEQLQRDLGEDASL